jgi:hypothetical protein
MHQMSAEALVIPINSPELIEPLEDFRYSVRKIVESSATVVYKGSPKESECVESCEMSAGLGEKRKTLRVITWIPSKDADLDNLPFNTSEPFVEIETDEANRTGHDGYGVTRSRNFSLSYIQANDTSRSDIKLLVNDYTGTSTHHVTSSKHTRINNYIDKNFSITTVTEITQRLRWAAGLVSKMAE